jgi:hypothetical protein
MPEHPSNYYGSNDEEEEKTEEKQRPAPPMQSECRHFQWLNNEDFEEDE